MSRRLIERRRSAQIPAGVLQQAPKISKRCSNLCCSDFYNAVEEEAKAPTDPLQNEPHPMFAREQFTFDPGFTEEKADDEWEFLVPTLRLATMLMTTDAFKKHVVGIVDGDIYLSAANAQKPRRGRKVQSLAETFRPDWQPKDIMIYPKQKYIDDAMRFRAEEIIMQLIDLVSFSVIDDTEDFSGVTDAVYGPHPDDIPLAFSYGCKSHITLAWGPTGQRCENERNLLNDQLANATTLLHETFGHALVAARVGHRCPEPYLRNCNLSECGHDVISAIFGGIIENIRVDVSPDWQNELRCREIDEDKRVLSLIDWPSNNIAHRYISARDATFGSRGQVGHFDKITRIPESFLSDIHSERWWADRGQKSTKEQLEGPLVPRNGPRWILKWVGARVKRFTNYHELRNDSTWLGEQGSEECDPRFGKNSHIEWILIENAPSADLPEWVRGDINKIARKRDPSHELGLPDDRVAVAGIFMDMYDPPQGPTDRRSSLEVFIDDTEAEYLGKALHGVERTPNPRERRNTLPDQNNYEEDVEDDESYGHYVSFENFLGDMRDLSVDQPAATKLARPSRPVTLSTKVRQRVSELSIEKLPGNKRKRSVADEGDGPQVHSFRRITA
ncbi:hypothetical protein CKM354_001289000 [Cercospora kikuchii]|uniref:Uncharacterized protein n=1 Tax=Cercospora kikuchii TaxID=84275 RepID=A0A9P3L375_9PEZI|nr:uncharacterized protein CKM354_001289000 [Cercospora kikuchii]GIZ49872.1 hypothetical protein CKM354_001289000 [Cercospora kikuchii]